MTKQLEIAVWYFINELKPDTLKLQNLLYLAQGFSFCMNDEEMFSEQFEAWPHGPVIPSVYHQYKRYGYNSIDVTFEMGQISAPQEQVLKQVMHTYGKYDGKYLEELTRNQDPWLFARQELAPDGQIDKIIPKEIISDYFIMLMFQPRAEAWM